MTPGRALPVPPLLIITDRHQAGQDLLDLAEAAFRAGARWLSLREKDLEAGPRLSLLRALVVLGAQHRASVTLHGDPEAAAAAGAAGVHLPAGGAVAAARRTIGPEALIGISVHDEAELAAAAVADYVTLSPVFLSASKPGYGPALEPAGLRALVDQSPCPAIALGGVTAATAAACLQAGAAGIAVMGSVMRAPDPGSEVRSLLAALRDRHA
ncbi:MAG: thiamine phosphate synthase [Kiloniellales bacterium]|nr:thiamine phosphate synthase [Kiloniellales bacterium]MDJ0981231.1 thiamine phosphate synthase [Kiloniellales bacterium]